MVEDITYTILSEEQDDHFQPLPTIRWLQPKEGPARLQSAWRGYRTGKIEWRDIPTVTEGDRP